MSFHRIKERIYFFAAWSTHPQAQIFEVKWYSLSDMHAGSCEMAVLCMQ